MQLHDWKPFTPTDGERFSEAKLQLLSALQWVAYIEHSYIKSDDQDEVFLHWSDEHGTICSGEFAENYGIEMHVNDLMMQFTAGGVPEDHKILLDERSPAEVEAWILSELLHRAIDREPFEKHLPYETTRFMSGDDLDFFPSEYEPELTRLARWLRSATDTITRTMAELGSAQKSRHEFRISPQNLNLEVDASGHVFGFSIGDDESDNVPYFYSIRIDGRKPSSSDKRTLKVSSLSKEKAAESVLDFFKHETIPS